MNHRRSLDTAEKVKMLSERLARSPQIARLDAGEAGTLAHALADLEEEFFRFLNDTLPRVTRQEVTDSELDELLQEAGEQFRHIIYHLRDPSYYEYLWEANGDDQSSDP